MSEHSAAGPTLAVDVGGTHMRAAIIDDEGNVLLRRAVPTPSQAEVPGALTDLIREVAGEEQAVRSATGVAVVGLPGPVDYRSGQLLWAPHLPETWPEQLSERQLSEQVGVSVRLANDADLAAVGEAYFGAGVDMHDVAYVTISTGIGAGVVSGGRLLHGLRSIAEVGHTIIDRVAWDAERPATLEELASGSGMRRMAADAGLGDVDGVAMEHLVASGDPVACQIWNQAVAATSIGVVNLTLMFAPKVVVIGGGLGRQPAFFDPVAATVERRAQPGLPPIPVVVAALGDDAALIGAARWSHAVPSP